MFKSKRLMAILAVVLCVMCAVNIFCVFADTESTGETADTAPAADTSLPGYASYAIENLDPELDGDLPESEQLLTLAQNYIDNYNTVVGDVYKRQPSESMSSRPQGYTRAGMSVSSSGMQRRPSSSLMVVT